MRNNGVPGGVYWYSYGMTGDNYSICHATQADPFYSVHQGDAEEADGRCFGARGPRGGVAGGM